MVFRPRKKTGPGKKKGKRNAKVKVKTKKANHNTKNRILRKKKIVILAGKKITGNKPRIEKIRSPLLRYDLSGGTPTTGGGGG